LKQERGERELGDSGARAQALSCVKEIVNDKDKLGQELANLRRSVQEFEERAGLTIMDLKKGLEAEVHIRMQADDALEKHQRMGAEESVGFFKRELQQEAEERIANHERLTAQLNIEMELREEVKQAAVILNEKIQYIDKLIEGISAGDGVRLEREERKLEDESLKQIFNQYKEEAAASYEDIRVGWQTESHRLWEALHTHTHDVHLKDPNSELDTLHVEARSMGRPQPHYQAGGVIKPVSCKFAGSTAVTAGKSPPPVSSMNMKRVSPGSIGHTIGGTYLSRFDS